MNKFLALVDGRKSYITSVLVALYTLLKAFGIVEVTPEQDLAIYGLLSAAFGIAIRHAIEKRS